MSVYKVEICGVNTAKLPILKEEEKAALFARIKQGDMTARETYIKGNLRLVLSVIKRFSGNQENIDDLFQIGCIGLIKSIDNFDDTLGVKFSTYAVPMIIGEIRTVRELQCRMSADKHTVLCFVFICRICWSQDCIAVFI